MPRRRKRRRRVNDSDDENESEEGSDEEASSHHHKNSKKSNVVNGNELYLFSSINRKVAQDFVKQLRTLARSLRVDAVRNGKDPNDVEIKIYINSAGGSLVDGIAIAAAIQTCEAYVTTIVCGEACSAATLISVSATKSKQIMPFSTFLVHELSSGVIGTYRNLTEETESCTKMMRVMKDLYMQNCPRLSPKTIDDCFKKDVIFTAEEALTLGFVDEIVQAW